MFFVLEHASEPNQTNPTEKCAENHGPNGALLERELLEHGVIVVLVVIVVCSEREKSREVMIETFGGGGSS